MPPARLIARIGTGVSAYRAALDRSPVFRHLAARIDNAMMAQAQLTAACNAKHHVEERVCRWLLEIHDRVGNSPNFLKQSTIAIVRFATDHCYHGIGEA